MRFDEILETDAMDALRSNFTFNKKKTKIVDGKIISSGHITSKDVVMNSLPVHFGKINGDFYASGVQLSSLMGSPDECKIFTVSYNKLKSLSGGPRVVLKQYNVHGNPLQSLDGLPESCPMIIFDYSESLELLKLFLVKDLLNVLIELDDAEHTTSLIINRVMKSKLNLQQEVLLAKRELIKNGYESNARL